jgi:hypothetical protein
MNEMSESIVTSHTDKKSANSPSYGHLSEETFNDLASKYNIFELGLFLVCFLYY